jgi:hypothetical protein
MEGMKMEITDSEACLKAFSDFCEEVNRSGLMGSEECQYWIFERGYKAALVAQASVKKVDAQFLHAAWATQPSLELDFALH